MHRISVGVFEELSACGGGPAAVAALVAARRSRTVLLLEHAVRASGDPEARRLWASLHGSSVLDDPGVGAWAVRVASGALGLDDLGLVAIAGAARRGRELGVRLAVPGRVEIPTLGVFEAVGASEVRVRRTPEGVTLSVDGKRALIGRRSELWRPMPVISVAHAGVTASFRFDHWRWAPLPRRVTIGDADVAPWRETLAAGWRVLVEHHPGRAAELAAAVRVLTPLPDPPSGTASLTLADAFGCVFLSLPPNPAETAVTLTHELQHGKLSVLLDLFALTADDRSARYYAPWRTDPRPLPGLLHGTYAHLAVAEFWSHQRLVEPDPTHADTEFARWHRATADAAETLLGTGSLTDLGTTLVRTIRARLAELANTPIPSAAREAAATAARNHRDRFRAEHGQL
ncbi:HEXXH motif-containing putative peptide modification protein [Actinokineospora auranticolor]|uniref:HEXXH motif-containing protein n=1 Tax=Actinokineospora auranticolor TaxID=155976 RepID=A0A2S6GQS7_9PSEU|nr:HEXXH motif-containing putative peptide modification protein [Actinokineospora auranticolor]PPK67608.1 HEXXH motif-containing protein [Actinokineospora auranticolor]